MYQGKTIQELKIGDEASFTKTITEADVVNYAGITGDFNPVHINEEYAKESIFQGRIAHGMLTVGLISAVLGTTLPGPGAIYVGQEIRFTAPVRINDTVTARVKVIEKNEEKNRVILDTRCYNQDDELVIDGTATIMLSKKWLNL